MTVKITTAEVQQIRQKAIFNGEVTRDQVKRLAQSWLEQNHQLDLMTSAAKAALDAEQTANAQLRRTT